jgi:Uncharacterized protein conserved in archaea
MSSYLFMISHPAHFHLFRNTIDTLKNHGHEVFVIIRPKDVLEQLCINAGMEYFKIRERSRNTGKIGLALSLIQKTGAVMRIVRKTKPDFMIGCDGAIAYAGRLAGIPSFDCDEDDAEATPLFAKLFYPFFTGVIAPTICSAGKWENKKIGHYSYHELAYLHPNHFAPKRGCLEKYGIDSDRPFYLVRFAQLTAHHDSGIHGIEKETALKLVSMLSAHGKVYITSERPLEPELEPYRMHIDPLDIHHIMAFADLFVGDSQTMAAEAGVLGTPFVRLNDFSGRLAYLNEIEDKYGLGYSHKSGDIEGFFQSVQKWLDEPERKKVCQERRVRMLAEKIDLTKFLVWFIEDFPVSRQIMFENPDYQFRFK